MLDSLREQLKEEDEKNKINGEDFKERSSSEFNMPFEVNPRDSQNTGLRSSGLRDTCRRFASYTNCTLREIPIWQALCGCQQ